MDKQFLLLVLLISSKLVFSTPDNGINEHDILIGYNDNFYYSIKTISYPSKTYYYNRDSAFLFERDLITGRTISKTYLSTRYHRDSTTNDDWKTKEFENENFNYADYLKEKEIKYLFPNVYRYTRFRNVRFDIDSDGLKLKYKNEKQLFLEINKVELFAPWIKDYLLKEEKARQEYPMLKHEYVTIFDFVGHSKYLFIILAGTYDPEYLQSIIVLRKDKLEAKIQNILN